jgi:hypothetical protein
MVVNDLDVFRPCGGPPEANSPLIVYADTVLPGTITRQSFQAVAGRRPEELQRFRSIQLRQLSRGDLRN